jgi:hypothetical protein
MRLLTVVTVGMLIGVGVLIAPARAEDGLPEEAQTLIKKLDAEFNAIQEKATADVRAAYEKCIADLQKLQEKYVKEGMLDEAVAVRDHLRWLKSGGQLALPDPKTLEEYRDRVGQTYFFKVVGATDGAVYGDDVYTDDSPLATAAVHAGVLKFGESGVVMVTILPGKASYGSSEKNGVSTVDYERWGGSYRIEGLAPRVVPAARPTNGEAPR